MVGEPNRRRSDHWRMLGIAGVIAAYMATNALVIVQREQQRTDSLRGREITTRLLCDSQNEQNADIRGILNLVKSKKFEDAYFKETGRRLSAAAQPLDCARLLKFANVDK